jgi:hypothetical protein
MADIAQEMDAARALMETLGPMLADDPDLLLDTIEGETGLMEVIDAMILADLADVEHIAGLKRAAMTLAERKSRIERRVETRRALIEQAMTLMDQKKLKRPGGTLTLSDRAPKVEVFDESVIPSRFFKTEPKLDREALKEAVMAGEHVPGAVKTNGSVSLTIRRA